MGMSINPIFAPLRVGINELLILGIGHLILVHKERIHVDCTARLLIATRRRGVVSYLNLTGGN